MLTWWVVVDPEKVKASEILGSQFHKNRLLWHCSYIYLSAEFAREREFDLGRIYVRERGCAGPAYVLEMVVQKERELKA
jgi:hypothetical protein